MFTPIESFLGGIFVCLSVISNNIYLGRVVGVSGILAKPLEQPGSEEFNYGTSFIAGMMSASLFSYLFLPFFFNPVGYIVNPSITNSIPFSMIILGFIVGIGTRYSNGCTSGHMVCGVARLSIRSFVATGTFCFITFLLVKIFRTADIIVQKETSWISYPEPSTLYTIIFLLIVTGIIYIFIFYYHMTSKANKEETGLLKSKMLSHYVIPFINAFVFTLGLIIGGMGKRQKVLGFFDVFGPSFDPSLAMFALSAIFLTGLLLNTVVFPTKNLNPLHTSMRMIPTSQTIDMPLILGAVIFGLGWGLSGFCPAPGFINIVSLDMSAIQWVIGCLLGITTFKFVIEKKH